jgi:hypothetical protein
MEKANYQQYWPIVHPTVEHLHGPEEVAYGMDELIVLCLVRDGRPYVRSFVEHYSSMDVKHLVFLDNGSTDGTVEALKEYDNVTVLRTMLPYKTHINSMRRYLAERFGQGRWSLYVDIDELFDYPYSDIVGLGSLLGYLNSNSYTAVVAQMLDMFPEKPLTGRADILDEPLKELHRFYDLSDLRWKSIKEHPKYRLSNTYGSNEIAALSGGIRLTVFGSSAFLTKHPLVFLDGKVKSAIPHWCRNARVADFTGVLFHYKFLDGLLHKQAAQAEERPSRGRSGGDVRYKQYLEVLEKAPSLSIKTDTSKALKNVNDLVGTRVMTVSRQYMEFVEREEQRSGYYSEERRAERLLEAFFNAKAEVTALLEEKETTAEQVKTLRRRKTKQEKEKSRLEKEKSHLEKEKSRLEKEKSRLEKEKSRLEKEKSRLEEESKEESKELKQRILRLVEQNQRLKGQLRDIHSSKSWQLLSALNRIRAQLLRR